MQIAEMETFINPPVPIPSTPPAQGPINNLATFYNTSSAQNTQPAAAQENPTTQTFGDAPQVTSPQAPPVIEESPAPKRKFNIRKRSDDNNGKV